MVAGHEVGEQSHVWLFLSTVGCMAQLWSGLGLFIMSNRIHADEGIDRPCPYLSLLISPAQGNTCGCEGWRV